mgnify:CR=1 FL=1|tara:strand:- start:23961 stop:24245 length:285 start_codon:yes stop_codon:yes gene_type:complete
MITRLVVKGSTLQVDENLLVFHYPLGDVDLIEWPKPTDPAKLLEWQAKLAGALYDAREMGYWKGDYVELPTGEPFHCEEHLKDWEPPSAEGWLY